MKKNVKVSLLTSILITTNVYAGLNVQPLLKKFVQPTNNSTEWSWQNIINLPKDEFDSDIPKFDKQTKSYTISRTLKSNNSLINYSVIAYGSKTAPNTIQFSSYTSGYDEEAKQLFKLSDIVNRQEVSKLRSNCTLKDANFGNGKGEAEGAVNSNVTQTIYKWNRPNASALYIAEQQSEGSVITGSFNHSLTNEYLIARSTNDLAKAMSQLKWNYNQKSKKVNCNFG